MKQNSSVEAGGRGLFHGDITAVMSSKPLQWRALVVEENILKSCEMPGSTTDRYFVALWCSCGTGEHVVGRAGYRPFIKPPGALTFIAPGAIPAARTANSNKLICCSLDASYVRGIEDELDHRPVTPSISRTGFTDPSISRLLELLNLEATSGGATGGLYVDQLAHALGTRILSLGSGRTTTRSLGHTAFPKAVLQRVLDKIHSSDGNIELSTLAAETGYSRRHFLRMFQKSLGMAPHQYLTEVKLQRAQELLKEQSRSLIDIALSCGFSSHSHFTRIFRAQRGITPNEMRRAL